jgi:ribose-phosphate pyrophosphokinase
MTGAPAETALQIPPTLPEEIREGIAFINGETHPRLGKKVADLLGVELCPVEFKRFPDTEPYARIKESVRNKQVIAFQTHAPVRHRPITDSFYQHLQMIDAAAGSHVSSVMAVAPNIAGARQDRQVLDREAVSADLNLKMLRNAGASDLVTVDIHDIHTLSSFHGARPDHLTAQPMLRDILGRIMTGDPAGYVFVSPDEGHTKTLRPHAEHLGIELKDMIKNRDSQGNVTHDDKVEGVEGRTCFLMDDMLGTGSTAISAAQALDKSGAAAIYAAFTHGWFSKDAVERLLESPITKIFVTDTLPIRGSVRKELDSKLEVPRLEVVSAAGIIATGLYKILMGESLDDEYAGQHLH